nr:hypothetical protein [Tanacetum cinerariifolium]
KFAVAWRNWMGCPWWPWLSSPMEEEEEDPDLRHLEEDEDLDCLDLLSTLGKSFGGMDHYGSGVAGLSSRIGPLEGEVCCCLEELDGVSLVAVVVQEEEEDPDLRHLEEDEDLDCLDVFS